MPNRLCVFRGCLLETRIALLSINGAANTATTITVGSAPYAVAVNPVTNQVNVANLTSNTVSVIDGVSNSITATIGVGAKPMRSR